MNILDAYKSAVEGNFIRYEDNLGDVFFIFQTTLHPLGVKELVKIDMDDIGNEKKCPDSLEGLDYASLNEVCLGAIKSNLYREVSYDEMLGEIQRKWNANN